MIHRRLCRFALQQEPELDVFLRPKGNPETVERDVWCQVDEDKPPAINGDVGGPLRHFALVLRAPRPLLVDVKPGDQLIALDSGAIPPALVTEVWDDGATAGRLGVRCCRVSRTQKGAAQ